jgi:parvulin-like peptidyl-prolyl isomerase
VRTSPRVPLRWRAFVVSALLPIGVLGSACQGGAPAAATVNGTRISESAVDSELHAIAANRNYTAAVVQQSQQPVLGQGKGTFALAFTDRVLTRQILYAIVHQEAVRRHLTVTPAQIATAVADQRAQLKDSQGNELWSGFSPAYQDLLARRAAEFTALQNSMVVADNAAVQKYYDANKAKLAQNCVSHILVATPALAQDIHQQLVNGADFATLARKYSTDTGSATKGGDLGCAPAGTYVAEFEAAVSKLAVGQLSAVVHSQFGYHLIKVTARRTGLADVRAEVVTQLQSQASAQLNQLVQTAVGRAAISVNPRYGTFDKASGQVTPPKAPPGSAGGSATTATTAPAATSPATAPPDTSAGTAGSGQGAAPPTSGP